MIPAREQRPPRLVAAPSPNWLWFWLVTYLVALPRQVRNLWWPLLSGIASHSPLPSEAAALLAPSLRAADLGELLPLVVVATGVALVAWPRWRGRRLVRRHRLTQPPALPTVVAITRYLGRCAPSVTVLVNVLRSGELAVAVPLGWRRCAIGVFGPLVALWSQDRAAAEAVLLHEAAHCATGDAIAVGAGSPLRRLLDRWLPVSLCLAILPVCLVWTVDAVRFVASAILLPPSARVEVKVLQSVTLALPALMRMAAGLGLWSLSTALLPLAATWSAELSADAAALATQRRADELLRALPMRAGSGGWVRRITMGISHPPVGLRRWLASVDGRLPELAQVTRLLVFPAAYLVRLALLLGRAALAYWGAFAPGEIVRRLRGHTAAYLVSVMPVWAAMTVLIAVWPWVRPVWCRLWWPRTSGRGGVRRAAHGWAALAMVGAGLIVAWAAGLV